MERSLGKRYIIKITGTSNPELKERPYVKTIDYWMTTTKDPFMARFFKRKETAESYLREVGRILKNLAEDNHNAKAELIEVELNISE
jgi:hypothetical protein